MIANRKRTIRLGVVAMALALVGPTPASPAETATCTIAAAGDVAGASDYRTGAARTASLILREDPVTVVALGDLAYRSGTAAEFATYYRPTWGQFEDRTFAVAGNHEYRTPGADGMEAELGPASNNNRGMTVCGWRLVSINQYKGIDAGAAFIKAQRTRYPSAPMIVAWHEPRWSSGSEHGNEPDVQPLWAAARSVRAKVVLNAHDHNYERFARMNTAGEPYARGTRLFISGLGGHGIRPLGVTQPHSRVRYTGHPAVLFLTLDPVGTYTWSAKRWDGVVFDSGQG